MGDWLCKNGHKELNCESIIVKLQDEFSVNYNSFQSINTKVSEIFIWF